MAASTSSSSANKVFYVRSSSGWNLEIDEALVSESAFIRSHLHYNPNTNTDRILPLPHVDFDTLDLVKEFCINRHSSHDHDTLNALDSQFFANLSRQKLHKLMLAAETLEIQSLFDLTRTRIAELDAQQRNEGNVEIQHTLGDWALTIFALSIILIFFILAIGVIIYRAIRYRDT